MSERTPEEQLLWDIFAKPTPECCGGWGEVLEPGAERPVACRVCHPDAYAEDDDDA